MANDAHRRISTSEHTALDERVHSLGTQVTVVQKDLHELRAIMASSAEVGQLSDKIDDLVTQIADRGRPQWQVIFSGFGVLLGVLTTIGYLVYRPIDSTMADLKEIVKSDISTQAQRFIPRSEIEQRWILADERYARLSKEVDDLDIAVNRSFTVKDAIESMRARLDRLQGIITAPLRRELPPQ